MHTDYGSSSFFISSSHFTYNTAHSYGGVMYTYYGNSSFNVSSSTFTYNNASYGGVMYIFNSSSSFSISNSHFTYNKAHSYGGVMYTNVGNPSLKISSSTFTYNNASNCGVMCTNYGSSSFSISSSNFTFNTALGKGGVLHTYSGNPSFNISSSTFTYNNASEGGIMHTDYGSSSFSISSSHFTYNTAHSHGGVLYTYSGNSSFKVSSSTFTYNNASYGGVMCTSCGSSSFCISSSNFTFNTALQNGGVLCTYSGNPSFKISSSTFTYNNASEGGIMHTDYGSSSFFISSSHFTYNTAHSYGGVMYTYYGNSSFNVSSSTFTYNNASYGGVLFSSFGDSFIIITSSKFSFNNASYSGGVMFTVSNTYMAITSSNFSFSNATAGGVIYTIGASFNISSTNFISNNANSGGVIYTRSEAYTIFISSFTISSSNFKLNNASSDGGVIYTSGDSSFIISRSNFTSNFALLNGGVIASVESTVKFSIESAILFLNNKATNGGVIFAIDSTVAILYIIKQQSHIEISRECLLVDNSAVRGGGIHATSSVVSVYQPGTLQLVNNTAEHGGGMYLQVNSKLNVFKTTTVSTLSLTKPYYISFIGNNATFGGGIFVADDTSSQSCLSGKECFLQSILLNQENTGPNNDINTNSIQFLDNTAESEQGSDLFGGLLDRCKPNRDAEVFYKERVNYIGTTYLVNITNVQRDSISSYPVRVCFCTSEDEPGCSYQLPIISVKKGEAFKVSVAAVDQVNNTVAANITASTTSAEGYLGVGQPTQSTSVGKNNCTHLTYNVYSLHDTETLNLYAEGPCGDASHSTIAVTVNFDNCTCPIGFEPHSNIESSCECNCDSKLHPEITNCNYTTHLVFKVDTNYWIDYINNTASPDLAVNKLLCPLDYCKPPSENVDINFDTPNGANKQCADNRRGILCGSCKDNFSLSLASSRCLTCPSYWPVVCIAIILAAGLAGILLVTALLALNVTVSVGLINGFIFYANIVSAGSAVFFPSSTPSPPSVFVAWLNLDIGIDVCFIDGLDAYSKTWLQLAFPAYVISIVVIIIIVSEHSPKFTRLIGRKDPVSTLATLVLLSYAKLLSVTITALSYATLEYSDGAKEIVWLPDGNLKYLQGKHIPLAIVALLIILIGLPYTILLFLWQWIVRAPKWKILNWTRHSKLNAFTVTYHIPYNSKYRFWTGLLLLVRVVLYIIASTTVSTFPKTYPLLLSIMIGSLFFFTKICNLRVYKSAIVDTLDAILYLNLLILSVFSMYDLNINSNSKKQTAVLYTSTVITFILLIGSICYQVKLLTKNRKPQSELIEYPMASVQLANAEVTYSVVDSPKRDQEPQPSSDKSEPDIGSYSYHRMITPAYTEQ